MQNKFLTHIEPYLKSYSELKPIETGLVSNIKVVKGIKAIVFDIYGTLIISASGDLDKSTVTVNNLTQALNQGGFFWSSNDSEKNNGPELLNLFHNTVTEQQEDLKKKGHTYPEVDIIRVWEHCIDISHKKQWIVKSKNSSIKILTVVFEILSNPVWPMPQMQNVLKTLQIKKIPLGIVSNAQFYTPIIMNHFISNEQSDAEYINGFDSDISIFSYKLLRSKPDTQLFVVLAHNIKKKYNLLPHQVLFVGNDMLKDIWTANQLGFKTALFAGDSRSLRLRENDDRCKDLKPDFVITELKQLLKIVYD